MAHKVHPKSFRLGTTTTWPSRWFARGAAYRSQVKEDLAIRDFFRSRLKDAQINTIHIERIRDALHVAIQTAKPGYVIGKGGAGIEDLKKKFIKTFFKTKKVQFQLTVSEIAKPALESALVAQQIAQDLERRLPFRRALKSSIERVKKAGALGVKVAVSGRLNGGEIARREWLFWGRIPLTNLRADIDYAQEVARTMAGAVGIKVWIYRGDIFEQDRLAQYQPSTPTRDNRQTGRRPEAPRERRPSPMVRTHEAPSA